MTKEFVYLMYLFSCGARGVKADNPDIDISWDKVVLLAQEQSILHTVIFAVKLMEDCSLPEDKKASYLSKLKNDSVSSFIRRMKIIKLLESFEAEGFRAVLLKGYVVASLYASPDSRISSDTDIYVDPKDEKKAYQLLRQNGFEVKERDRRSHHAVCNHPEMGHLELHNLLYDDIIEDIWFGENDSLEFVKEPYLKTDTDEGTYYTLGKTDNLIFLALHMIKHFIESGMSLRLIMDFSLFLYKNNEDIDMARFWDTMNRLEYSYFIKIIIRIAERYFMFEHIDRLEADQVDEADVDAVLDDMEAGGWLGFNDKKMRDQGWHEYNRIKFIENKGKWGYKFYMFIWNAKGYFKALFPARKNLAARFPYVRKTVLLVPVAWIHRFFNRGFAYLFKGESMPYTVDAEEQLNATAKKRVELFRQMKII
jgi:hypothetical protein